MADDPRSPSLLERLFRREKARLVPPIIEYPKPDEDEPQKRKSRKTRGQTQQLRKPDPDRSKEPPIIKAPVPVHVPVAFYTGQTPKSQRRSPTAAFEEHSESGRMKHDQEFERTFKGEVARAEALDAMNDAAIVREKLQKQHIERTDAWMYKLDRMLSGGRVWSPEGGAAINQEGKDLQARHHREMQEVEDQLKRTLQRAAALDLKIDIKRQKRLGYLLDRPRELLTYTPNRPRDFAMAARDPSTPGPAPDPGGRPVLDHPFNDAATKPAQSQPAAAPAFNDAVTAPDPLAAWFARFSQSAPAPDPNRPGMAPSV